MKRHLQWILLIFCLSPFALSAQLANGNINANFGIDADTKSNYVKYGPVTGNLNSDDWFSPAGLGNHVIDTFNAAAYRLSLQSGKNISFTQRMSAPLYAKLGGKLWLDAAYGRDFSAASSFKDSTTFTIASKNGDDPAAWRGGVSNFPNKNDLVDVYAHMRRDGTNVHDSLWFFTGVSTFGTTGSSYYDIELYKKNFSYSAATGIFSSAGTEAGHTQWLFDAAGNIIQTGDMIVAVNFSPGSVPVVDLRIWISQATRSVIPAYFNFSGSFDGATASPAYGYASIVSKTGSTAWGAGISNYSASAVNDTTYSTPWGTATATAGLWDANYQTQQFIEVGLNLTRIGVDPALYGTLSPCQSLFSNIFFKSRSSNSFTSNMQDFMIPLVFLRNPVMDYTIQPDTLRCNRKIANIQITTTSTAGYFNWQTADGLISGAATDSSQISVTKAGTYIVSSSPAEGCPVTRTDTVRIPIDTFPPVASINVSFINTFGLPYFQFFGGDVAASNYMTPFGGSQGLLWAWNGPYGFASTIQNPSTAGTGWGDYRLIVTEKRNGCTDTVIKSMNEIDFSVLADSRLALTGAATRGSIVLSWQDSNQPAVAYYEIERSASRNSGFSKIGSVSGMFAFTDNTAQVNAVNFYRLRAVTNTGGIYYSATVGIISTGSGEYYQLKNNGGPGWILSANTNRVINGTLTIYNNNGQVLRYENLYLQKGNNAIELTGLISQNGGLLIAVLKNGNEILLAQKIIL
jgi:hypothetical protein